MHGKSPQSLTSVLWVCMLLSAHAPLNSLTLEHTDLDVILVIQAPAIASIPFSCLL